MYVVPIIALLILIAIATAWAPIFAVIIAVPLFVLFLAYVGFSRRADEKATRPSGEPVSGEGGTGGGIWGEKS